MCDLEIRNNENIIDLDLDLDFDASVLLFPEVEPAAVEHADSIPDALIRCIRDTGRVDMRRIAMSAGVTTHEAIEELRGSVFCNPDTWKEDPEEGWETSDEYLSGNLRQKLIKAREAYKTYRGTFIDNIRALESILPSQMTAKNIYVTLGSPWLPPDIIDDFINYLIKPNQYDKYKGTRHDEETGSWELPDKSQYKCYIRNTSTFGTKRIHCLNIIESTLNMKPVKVTDEENSSLTHSGSRRAFNQEETAAALEKQRLIISAFRNWIWSDRVRSERLIRIYEERYGYNVARRFDGRILTFPGMSPSVSMRRYQKDCVFRILFTPNTLVAHDVGAGKTYILIAAGMELIRLGMASKVMYAVPNNIIGQWRDLFMTLYPEARILCVKPSDFTPEKKMNTLRKIRDEKYDGILIAYSCFDSIPLSKQFYIDELTRERDELLNARNKKKDVTGKLKRKIERINKKLGEAAVEKDPSRTMICFDELGIDRLFVDEAHNYKNVSIDTTITGVYGINRNGSDKCNSMLSKVRHVQNKNNGGGVVMATGTPITNSITDIFVFQKYLQNGELELLGLQTFQSWVAMFAEKTTEFEIAVDTNTYRMTTRFAKFHNIPELTAILASIADFHMLEHNEGLPEFKGYTDVIVPRSVELKAYIEDISRRADKVHNRLVKREEDNMLKITSDGRKAALDIRLVRNEKAMGQLAGLWNDIYGDVGRCKVSECAEKVALLYRKTAEQRSVQLVFCDISTPCEGFNVYDELRRLLLKYGVANDEIAYIHDATTDRKREKLFDKVRKGQIRVLIGSTFKLGLGVNIQDKLIALHHLDVPWRPADMVQREGRILRNGNTNPEIYIFRYITEGSFDAYSWQLLETKQKFIVDILTDSYKGRSGDEVDDTVLNYAEVKALALGNPLLKSRVETQNEISRLKLLRKKNIENKLRLEQRYEELPDLITEKRFELELCTRDLEHFRESYYGNHKSLENSIKSFFSRYRKYIRDVLVREINNNAMRQEERNVAEYKGFSIVMPAGMDPDYPYVYLVREGRYRVDFGDKEGGMLVRIDNFLDKLDVRAGMLRRQLELLMKEQQEIEAELAADDGFSEILDTMTARLGKIDDQLGVNDAV